MIRYQSNPVQPIPEPEAKPAPAGKEAPDDKKVAGDKKARVAAEDMDKRDWEKLGPVILDA